MRGDIKDLIDFITKEDLPMYNKAELARRYDCDPRTIDSVPVRWKSSLPHWKMAKQFVDNWNVVLFTEIKQMFSAFSLTQSVKSKYNINGLQTSFYFSRIVSVSGFVLLNTNVEIL